MVTYAIRLCPTKADQEYVRKSTDDDIGLKLLYEPRSDAQDADAASSVEYHSRNLLQGLVLRAPTA